VVLVPFFVWRHPIGDQGQRGDREDEYLLNPVKTLLNEKEMYVYIYLLFI
jgi:hypothetical protein